jgi:hypothetical protein
MFNRNRRTINHILAGAFVLAAASPLLAQTATQAPASRPQPVEARPQPQYIDPTGTDARETREQLRELLGRNPPPLGRVLKLDPSLMNNDAYMASYPQLAAFLKQHPEVAHNPGYYLDWVAVLQGEFQRENDAMRVWNNMMEGITVIGVISLIVFVLTWLIRTVIDYRRWSRLSKVQADVNNKLFDRFSSNEDLLTYIQSPAGRRFLEAAPVVPSAVAPRPLGAPTSRILWSVQIGIVIAAGALGILFVSGRVIEEVAQPLFAIASIGISLGIGFVVSSAVAYGLSRSMGLIEQPPARPQGGEPHD